MDPPVVCIGEVITFTAGGATGLAQAGGAAASLAATAAGALLVEETCCTGSTICCGDSDCCDPTRCCPNGECCPQECEGCLDHGSLSGGIIEVDPPVVCIGEMITFSVSGVEDSGGIKRVMCSASQAIPPVEPTYTWVCTLPPLPPPQTQRTQSGSGPVASITTDAPGTYTCTFTATANRECPPLPRVLQSDVIDTCQPTALAGKFAPVCQVTMKVKEITFLNDDQVYANAPPANWGKGSALLPPDWRDTNNPKNALCYTRSSAIRMQVLLEIEASGVETPTLRVTGPNGITGTAPVTTACGKTQQTVIVTTTPLPNYVTRYETMPLQWEFQRLGDPSWHSIVTTNHHIFVTYGAPQEPPTQWRLHDFCGAAALADTALKVIEGDGGSIQGIHKRLNSDPPEDGCPVGGPTCTDDWPLMSGPPYEGECDEQAQFMVKAVQLVGGPQGSWYNVYPSRDCDPSNPETDTAAGAGITWDIDGDGTIGEESLILRFDFDGGPGTNINAFEGAVEYSSLGRHYAVWPSLKASSKCELLLKVRDDAPEPRPVQCWALVANPWQCIRNPVAGLLEGPEFPTCAPGCP